MTQAVLYVGDLNPHCRSRQRFEALRRLALDVEGLSFAPRGDGTEGPPPSLRARLASRARLPLDSESVNRRILERLRHRPVDVLWIDKVPCLRPATLREARRIAPRLRIAFHSDDDMFARHNRSRWLPGCLPHFDVVFTAKSYNTRPDELPALGARRVVFVAQAFDPQFHRPVAVSDADRQRLGAEVGFVGTFEAERARSMLALAQQGVEVRVFGNGWAHWRRRHPRLRVEGRPVYGEDYIRCLNATSINLGFLRRMNRDLHTSRSLDIPACGAFLLAERTEEHQALFAEGSEAAYFAGDEELLERVRQYLADPRLRHRIAAGGRRRCVEHDYTHDGAMRRMLLQLDATP